MNREQLIENLCSRALICFNNSIDSKYETNYLEIGRDYLSLAKEVSRKQINNSELIKKLNGLQARTEKLVEKDIY